MCSLIPLLALLLATLALSAPQASPVAGAIATPPPTATPAASGVSTGPAAAPSDQCGPRIPDPNVPDSCDSFVQPVDSPAAYGVNCSSDGTGATLNATSCEELIPILCEKQWQHPGEWTWATYDGCTLGAFLPPIDYTGAAPWPAQVNCEVLIYGAMLQTCDDGTNQYNQASVNLRVYPDNTPGGKGEAVNVGYPSYLIAESPPRNLSDKTCTEGIDPYPTPCAFVKGPNAVQLPAAGLISQALVQEATAASGFYAEYASETAAAAAAGFT